MILIFEKSNTRIKVNNSCRQQLKTSKYQKNFVKVLARKCHVTSRMLVGCAKKYSLDMLIDIKQRRLALQKSKWQIWLTVQVVNKLGCTSALEGKELGKTNCEELPCWCSFWKSWWTGWKHTEQTKRWMEKCKIYIQTTAHKFVSLFDKLFNYDHTDRSIGDHSTRLLVSRNDIYYSYKSIFATKAYS